MDIEFDNIMRQYKETLDEILGDPLLCDLSQNITLDELKSQLTLEFGQAMTVLIRKADQTVYPVIVALDATVADLKKGIERYVLLHQSREGEKQNISWKYVWKSYWLVFDGQKLNDSNVMLKDMGISNRCEVKFVKRLKSK